MMNYGFVKVPDEVNVVGIKNSRGLIKMLGVWPLVNENLRFLDIIAVGNKNGIDEKINLALLKNYFPKAKFIFNCQSGPYLVSSYQKLLENFDGHMTLDYDQSNPKSLYMNHSMMVRSMPFENFFWEPEKEKRWDFSILTSVGDNIAKRWNRCIKIVDKLCSHGFSGLIVTQTGDFDRVLKAIFSKERIFKKYANRGLLYLSNYIDPLEFHKLQAMAHVGIFPNSCDAFPKAIIENILADKLVVVSNDLLIGKSVIVPEFGECLDFDLDRGLDRCLEIVKKEKIRKKLLNNRQRWLKKYGFVPLAKLWAKELNKKFQTKCKMAFFYESC